MADRIKIDGLDDALRCFDEAPKNMLKLSKKASQAGARAVTRYIKRGEGMGRWTKLVTAKVKKTRDGRISSTIGLYNKAGLPSGSEIPDWFKAYWLNYGTLEGRDSSHSFQFKVKHRTTQAAKNRRGVSGIKHRNFFEASIEGWDDIFVEAFENYLEEQQNELYDR